mgnify:CR=1 FL=1
MIPRLAQYFSGRFILAGPSNSHPTESFLDLSINPSFASFTLDRPITLVLEKYTDTPFDFHVNEMSKTNRETNPSYDHNHGCFLTGSITFGVKRGIEAITR